MTPAAGHTWDAIVIGSGLGGLAAGCALARKGKRVLVLERLANFGGAATTWRHGRLTMEASLHETDGGEVFSENGAFRELGVLEHLDPIPAHEFYEVRGKALPTDILMPHGLSEGQAALTAAFPQHADAIAAYTRALQRLRHTLLELEDLGVRGLQVMVDALFSGRLFELLGDIPQTLDAAMQRFLGDAEAVKLALAPHLVYFDDDPAKMSFLGFAAITARYSEDGGYYLRGGSKSLTLALLHKIQEVGGEARHRRTVTAILTDDNGRACGVRHRGPDGDEAEDLAFVLLGNASPTALREMLPAPERDAFFAPYAAHEPSISLFSVALGLDRPPADFGVRAYSTYVYPDWMTRLDQYPVSADVFGGEPGAALPLYGLCDYARLDPKLGPEGDLYPASLTGVDRLWAWEGYDEAADHARREAWIGALLDDLDRRFPGIRSAVQHAEMATARTMKNRLGTPHGEAYGFRPTPKRLFARPPSPRTAVPGLWLASAYTLSGGYAGALHGGMLAARAALSEMNRRSMRAK